ncbi:MAG: mycofactocin precursor MftA [Acidimicrobiales bacterium]
MSGIAVGAPGAEEDRMTQIHVAAPVDAEVVAEDEELDAESGEVLVEEISIDGMCGVY